MARRRIVAGNWKMYKTIEEATGFIQKIAASGVDSSTVYLAVPFTALQASVQAAGDSGMKIGAQNMHDVTEGAFTGEIAGRMLREAGASFVLLGHSERRHVFNESDDLINRKVKRALEDGLEPVFCIGEKLEQREAGQTSEVLRTQIEQGLDGLETTEIAKIVMAYEPVWAIGTGRTATPDMAQEAHQICRACVAEKWGEDVAQGLSILYGGSVKPDNAANLMGQADVDGVLVGGASLDPDSFVQIIKGQVAAKGLN